MRRVLAVLAAAMLGFGLVAAAPANASTALPGMVWWETLPTGERVQFYRSPEGMDITTHAIKRDVFQCPIGQDYACVWTGDNATGTFGRYNTNNVYSNTANGVAHCWNMSAPFNNNTKYWANFSDRSIDWVNWVNCNRTGGFFAMEINSHWGCAYYPNWCGNQDLGYPRTTSIKAYA